MKKIAAVISIVCFGIPALAQNVQTATNGLYYNPTSGNTARTVGLGGTLTQNTSIDLGASYELNFKKSTANYLKLKNNGNVSIGLNDPTEKLSIFNGNISIATDAGSLNTVMGALKISWGSTPGAWAGLTGSTNGGGLDQMDLAFHTAYGSAVERMRILSSGAVGIGTSNPSARLEVVAPSGSAENVIVNVKDVTATYNPNRVNQTVSILPTVGLDANVGITWHNDGSSGGLGLGLVSSQKLVGYATASTYEKIFRVNDVSNNLANFSLEFKNTSASYPNPSNFWHYKPNTSHIIAWNKPLNIGATGYPVRLYADNATPNKVADLFVYNSKVGIGTETPDVNAKLDVNGNIYTNGRMGIGTTNFTDANYRLFVETGIRTRKIKVDQATWPDYVFENDYPLLPLSKVETFIKKNKHLPDVPSESDIKKDGLDLGDMQEVLLKKIEELTLYSIEQEKRLNAQEEQINKLLNEMESLKKAAINNK